MLLFGVPVTPPTLPRLLPLTVTMMRRVIVRRQAEVKRGRGAVGRRGGQVEGDGGAGVVVIARAVGDNGLDEIPVGASSGSGRRRSSGRSENRREIPATCSRSGWARSGWGRCRRPTNRRRDGICRRCGSDNRFQKPSAPTRAGVQVTVPRLLVAPPVTVTAKCEAGKSYNSGGLPPVWACDMKCARRARAKGVESVIVAGDDVGHGEISIRVRLRPELIGLHPLLKIIRRGGRDRLLNQADPQVRRRRRWDCRCR